MGEDDPTQQVCPEGGRNTHHLIPTTRRGKATMVCIYCDKSRKDLTS